MKNYQAVVSMGDPNGIGPEIVLKYHANHPETSFLLAGKKSVIIYWSNHYDIPFHFDIIDTDSDTSVEPGKETVSAGKVAYESVCLGWKKAKELDLPLITLPISKHSIALSYRGFTGHTELLASLDQKNTTDDIVMLLGGEKLKVATLTRHIPLQAVSQTLTREYITRQIRLIWNWFIKWKKYTPGIWITGLNPHAGENGDIGTEEHTIITPALEDLRQENIFIEGPFPADTMFYFALKESIDICISCYHDQGLVPLKMVHFEDGVNVTIGLSQIRTSVDHGTAFNIAGKGIADIKSFETAVTWGIDMHQNQAFFRN